MSRIDATKRQTTQTIVLLLTYVLQLCSTVVLTDTGKVH